ncbi:MAG: hypothetical protein GY714_15265, partial [Desulfobacterales bacterium]|nr:hypothetical protein [Desulfobacterales bacterium]
NKSFGMVAGENPWGVSLVGASVWWGRQFGGGGSFFLFWFYRIDFFEDVGEGRGGRKGRHSPKTKKQNKRKLKKSTKRMKKSGEKREKKEGETLEMRGLILRELQKNKLYAKKEVVNTQRES